MVAGLMTDYTNSYDLTFIINGLIIMVSGLMLLAVEAEGLGPALRWERARGGDLFPHLYAPLRRAGLAWAKPLPLRPEGTHLIPEDVA